MSIENRDTAGAVPASIAKRLGINAAFADLCAAVLMVATVMFNAGLAFVNAYVFGLNNMVVVLVQAGLIAGAAAVSLLSQPRGIGRWIAFAWLMLVLNVTLMLLRSSFDLKPIGDVLVLPVFVALGLCMTSKTLIRTLLFLQCVLVVFVIWELFLPTSFSNLFAVREYYIATRGFSETKFWAGTDSLFLSSQRPGGRLLKVGFDINRGSSLFLEPVTLGNWTIVVTVAMVTFWKEISSPTKIALLFTNLLLVIGCDGRLALATNIALLLTMSISTRLPRLVPFLYLPLLFTTLATLVGTGTIGIEGGTDSNIGRYANSTMTFMNLQLSELFGIVTTGAIVTADSGWAYICLKQSLFGLIALWVAVTLMVPFGDKGRRFSHSAGIFIALGLPVSFSIVSIKMAATLWIIAGCASREIWNDRAKETGEAGQVSAMGERRPLATTGRKPFLAASLIRKRAGA